MSGKTEGWLILISLITVLVGGYLLVWRGRRPMLRRIASLVIAIVAAAVAVVGTIGYAIPTLKDALAPNVSFSEGVIVNLPIWTICLAAWFIAIRFLVFTLRGHPAP